MLTYKEEQEYSDRETRREKIRDTTCICGSGRVDTFNLFDARGIYISKVCTECVEQVKRKYRPDIFTDSNYWTDEPIDEED